MTMEIVTKKSTEMTMPTIAPELTPPPPPPPSPDLLVSIVTKVTTCTLSVTTVNPAWVNWSECACIYNNYSEAFKD